MPKFSQIKPTEMVRLLEKNGFVRARQKGSHLTLVNEVKNKQVVVYMHPKSLKKGTIHTILKQAGLDRDLL
ncbi:MAG: hypothetical protein A3H70_04615 [Candidatus Komeilibacteria bacterium RIFCSPLOWO2_02_FULL_48_11]|uniref:Toxin HicA n=1 Tax=Candidatus Komeilibacteria bacterium RIFCSPLOWO2_02_FULL_48_11 TaxID=1798553 RepID=A0A1G2BTZ7_9BACT|nr:MAG: hypothetical protein A3H70_04615 [Candidatus Komeilibacteria bacterium RIFCSPLOWO2_02_FULL_48_11]